ncbi:MAG: hypothetical protein J5737_04010, partial [Bacteroidales bacterium]|nr:hypothetical protein [Bacteroidales bacterium]
FMLKALRDIGSLPLSDAALAAYAARLGSDCAFFIHLHHQDITAAYAPSLCQAMFATGRGEILEPFELDLSAYELRVEIPLDAATGLPVAVSTREAYSEVIPREGISRLRSAPLEMTEEVSPVFTGMSFRAEGFARSREIPSHEDVSLREALRAPVEQWKDCVVNDFERGVFAKHPEIAALKQRFYDRGAIYAAMSGSGSAVFGLFRK